jgi:hypothetical protein
VVHACKPSTQEAVGGELRSQPGPHNMTCLKKKKKDNKFSDSQFLLEFSCNWGAHSIKIPGIRNENQNCPVHISFLVSRYRQTLHFIYDIMQSDHIHKCI